jgi:hypothetical protein
VFDAAGGSCITSASCSKSDGSAEQSVIIDNRAGAAR